MSFFVKVISQSCNKESGSLFDYSIKDIKQINFDIKKDCKFYLEKGIIKIDFDCEKQKIEEDNNSRSFLWTIQKEKENGIGKNLFKLNFRKENKVEKYSIPKEKQDISLVLKHTSLKYGYKLKKKDVIQLGKVRFKVREISMEDIKLSENVSNAGRIFENKNEYGENNDDNIKIHLRNKSDNLENKPCIISNDDNLKNNYDDKEIDLNDSIENLGNLNNTYSNVFNLNTLSNLSPFLQSIQTEEIDQIIFRNYSFSDQPNLDETNFNILHSHSINNYGNLNEKKFLSNRGKQNMLLMKNQNKYSIPSKITENSSKNLCRICLNDGKEEILISVCKCIGSVKYIHFNCLQKWLLSKINIKSNFHLIAYSFEKFICELCKAEIPNKIKIKEKVFKLIETKNILEKIKSEPSIIKIFGNNLEKTKFIALELLIDNLNDQSVEKRHMYIFCFGNKQNLKIGRSTETEIRLSDYSISRNHSKIELKHDGFYLNDLNSKFGTLIDLSQTNEIILLPNQKISIQVDHLYLSFCLFRNSSCLNILRCNRQERFEYQRKYSKIDYNYNKIILGKDSTNLQKVSITNKIKIAEVEENMKNFPIKISYSTPIKFQDGENSEKYFKFIQPKSFEHQISQLVLVQGRKPSKLSLSNGQEDKYLTRNFTKSQINRSKSYTRSIVENNNPREEKFFSKRPISIRIQSINNFIEKDT